MTTQTHLQRFFSVFSETLRSPSVLAAVEELVGELLALRDRGGRLFCIGVGGGAANAAHAVCDLRKLCCVEAYAPTDSVAELTARANDEDWGAIFTGWLSTSRLGKSDAIMVFSVGGGFSDVSPCIANAVSFAKDAGARVLGIVGSPSGATALMGDAVVVSGLTGPMCTPVTEAAQAAIHHAIVSDPRLQVLPTKW